MRAFAKADIAFIAASELKAKDQPIPAGKVSASDLGDLVSYSDDPLAVLKLTGAQIKQALEKAVSIYPQPNLGFLQVSGMKFTFLKDGAGGRAGNIDHDKRQRHRRVAHIHRRAFELDGERRAGLLESVVQDQRRAAVPGRLDGQGDQRLPGG